jgi:hypothetical protein
LHQFFHHLYHLLWAHFLSVWLCVLVFTVVGGALLGRVGQGNATSDSESTNSRRLPTRVSAADAISIIVFLLFLTFYVVMILYKEDFGYYDADIFTDFSVRAINYATPIWPDQGRFFPLGHQEFNLLRHLTTSASGYHSYAIVQLLILLGALFALLSEFTVLYRTLILMAVMVTPSFVIAFTGLIYPERNVLLWLGIMMFCLHGYYQTKGRLYFVGCLAATHCALYYKETVVVLVATYAGTRLVLDLYGKRPTSRAEWHKFARNHTIHLGILVVSCVYVSLFGAAMIRSRTFSYVASHRVGVITTLVAYLVVDWIVVLLAVVFAWRVWKWLSREGELFPMWDSLAAAALVSFISLAVLGLYSGYYTAPSDLIGILYIARVGQEWLAKRELVRAFVMAVVVACVLIHNIAFSSFRVIERKSLIASERQLAEFLQEYRKTARSRSVELFFPYTDGYRLMELSAYLKYKGLPLEGQKTPTDYDAGASFAVEGPAKFVDSRCVGYKDYLCVHAENAGKGALIVVLPDDGVSMREVANTAGDSVLVFSVDACSVCGKMGSWFKVLHVISPRFAGTQLPEHWLQLHVFQRPG